MKKRERSRITLQRRGAETDDGFTKRPGTWQPLAAVWAELLPLWLSEYAAAGETAAFQRARFKILKDSRWADLNAKDGLIADREYDILGVSEAQRGWLMIDAVARGDG
jgi:head-tail adaptor